MAKNQGFLIFSGNFVFTYFWIWCEIKVHIISFVRAQILYLGRFWLFTYEPKCCKPIRLQDSVEKKSMNQLIFGMQINIQET